MTAIKEQAIELINGLSDEKIYYLVNFIKAFDKNETAIDESIKAYQELQQYRKKGTVDRDYKNELYSALEEKFESLN
jgi:uncharacterized protein YbaP (TraB family)